MSNLKELKIMKKLLYSVLALAGILAVSCNKETEAPVTPDQTKGEKVQYTIKAIYSEPDDVRTAYADDKTFSWVKGDSIFVRCIDADGEYWGWRGFEAQEGGAETTFTAELEDGWRPYDVAVYQAYHQVASVSYNDANVRVSMPISYHLDGYGLDADAGTPYYNSVAVPSANPLSVLPLVGTAQEDGSLRFQTGVSVLKVNLTDLDATADHVAITSPDGVLGNYLMVKESEIRISEPWCNDEGTRYATSFVEYYFTPVSDGKLSFYLPIPVGTLSKGTTLEVMDAKDNVLFKKAFTKDVEMPRNKVVELAELSTKVEWNTLGTGKFGRKTAEKIILALISSKDAHWRQHTKGIGRKKNHILGSWASTFAMHRQNDFLDMVYWITHTSVLGDTLVGKIDFTFGIHSHILQQCVSTYGIIDVRFALFVKIDDLGITSTFKIEYAFVIPAVFIVANK